MTLTASMLLQKLLTVALVELRPYSAVKATSSAVNFWPLWKNTSSRNVKLQVFRSALVFQAEANSGRICIVASS